MSGSIKPGVTLAGSLVAKGQTDTVSFVATAGDSYEFDVVSNATSTLRPEVRIIDASGAVITNYSNSSGGFAETDFIAANSGTYAAVVIANPLYGQTGTYTLSETQQDDFGNTPQTAGTLAIGGTLNGNLESYDDRDWINVTLKAGFSYEFDVISDATSGLRPVISLLTPDGSIAVGDSQSSSGVGKVTYTPTTSGVYDILIKANTLYDQKGTYKLVSSSQDDYGNTVSTAGTLAIGGTLAGNIEAVDDTDWFGVTLTSGKSYQFNLTSTVAGGFSPSLELLTPAGAVAINPTASKNGSASFSYTPTVSGAYDLVVSPNASTTGSYQISAVSSGITTINAGSGATAQTIPSGSNYVSTAGANTIFASGGATTINSATGSPVIFGNTSSLNFVGGSGAATVIGGTAKNTVTGGSGSLVLFAVSTTTFTAGAGAATVIGGQGGLTATLGAGGGAVFGGTGATNSLFVAAGSTGNAALVGTGDGDVLTDAGAGQDFLVAGAGAETLDASRSTGKLNAFFGGSGADSIVGGAGQSFFLTGSGNETLTGGTGLSEFVFLSGSTTRVDTITNFNSGDILAVFGYGTNAAANVFAAKTVTSSGTTLKLTDNTTIVLQGFTNLSQSNLVSG
jgi:Ca2+-binding RTX toxin-like protein